MVKELQFHHVVFLGLALGGVLRSLLTAMMCFCGRPFRESEMCKVTLKLPDELFISRTGKCYHLNQDCQKRQDNLIGLKPCQLCLKKVYNVELQDLKQRKGF